MHARIKEIVALCRAREFEAGLKKTDDLLRRSASIPSNPANSEFQQKLRKLKASLENELAPQVMSEVDG
jgi:hypothetical protein